MGKPEMTNEEFSLNRTGMLGFEILEILTFDYNKPDMQLSCSN
jgi:hypothetical protein